jgi:hypothetical protein
MLGLAWETKRDQLISFNKALTIGAHDKMKHDRPRMGSQRGTFAQAACCSASASGQVCCYNLRIRQTSWYQSYRPSNVFGKTIFMRYPVDMTRPRLS